MFLKKGGDEDLIACVPSASSSHQLGLLVALLHVMTELLQRQSFPSNGVIFHKQIEQCNDVRLVP